MVRKPRRKRSGRVKTYISEITAESTALAREIEGLPFRDQVRRIAELHQSARDLGVSAAVAHGYSPASALVRIQQYFIEHAGTVITGEEIQVVSGISEYARRIRQIRVEMGFRILSGASPDPESGIDLRPDEYLLTSKNADQNAARKWKMMNDLRRRKGLGSRERILEFLKANVGKVVTTEDLSYVSNEKREFGRRTRELRTEEGYPIATKFTGRPDLGVGEYVLLSTERIAEAHDRHIPNDVQRDVYSRDKNTCRLCGWNLNAWTEKDPRILELHHVQHHQKGGQNVAKNLVTICSRCHDRIHAGTLRIPDSILENPQNSH